MALVSILRDARLRRAPQDDVEFVLRIVFVIRLRASNRRERARLMSSASSTQQTKRGYLERPGCRLYYEATGAGPAIVFAHGLGGNHMSWWQQVPHFAGRYTCVTFAHPALRRRARFPAGPIRPTMRAIFPR